MILAKEVPEFLDRIKTEEFALKDVLTQARRKCTKINFSGPEIAGWGGGLPRAGVGVEKLVPSLESLKKFVLLGFRGREPVISREFCWDVPN